MELLHDVPTDWRVESSTNSVIDANRSSGTRKKSNFYEKNIAMNNLNDVPKIEEQKRPTRSNSSSRMNSKRNSDSYSLSENNSRRVSKQNKEVSFIKRVIVFGTFEHAFILIFFLRIYR